MSRRKIGEARGGRGARARRRIAGAAYAQALQGLGGPPHRDGRQPLPEGQIPLRRGRERQKRPESA